MTKQCSTILEVLNHIKSHPTAEEIYDLVRKKHRTISLGTVYRNLEKLKNQGKVKKFYIGENKYRWDGTLENHFHIRCKFCYKVIDVFDACIKKLKNKVVEETGYDSLNVNIEITGICPSCNERGRKCQN